MATLEVQKRLMDEARPMLRVPTLVQLAGVDALVNNAATYAFLAKGVENPALTIATYAKHGMWLEQDEFRTPVLDAAAQWFTTFTE